MAKRWKGRRVQIVVPCKRCCATGCGDKIKPMGSIPDDPDDIMIEVTDPDGKVAYLEDCCVDYFVHGHPDYGHPIGDLELDGEVLSFDKDFHKPGDPRVPGVVVVPIDRKVS